jgi:hypothetical protein
MNNWNNSPEKGEANKQYLEDTQRAIDWLSKNSNLEPHRDTIEVMLHVADLLANFWSEIKKSHYPSLTTLFESELTPAELIELNTIWDQDSERWIFLWAIQSRELERTDAEVYSKLKFREQSGESLTEEEWEKLAKYEEQMLDDSALDISEINPAVRAEATSIVKSEEVAANIIGILKKGSEI